MFISGIGVNDNLHWSTPQSVPDFARYVAVGDNGHEPSPWNVKSFAWPDLNTCGMGYGVADVCGASCHGVGCQSADWANCAWTVACGFPNADYKVKFWEDANFRSKYARHMGGVNLGFLDGHAKWCTSESIWGAWQSKDKVSTFIDDSF
jgi:prepilin-type processing-associated H-X9-DG protein